MKSYEKAFDIRLKPPFVLRLDGRSFSKFTKQFKTIDHHPFSDEFSDCMDLTLSQLMRETNARFGYTQSDEISLLFTQDNPESQTFFDGKLQKLCSITSCIAANTFNDNHEYGLAQFDCQGFNLSDDEVWNYFFWREKDAVRNSVSMLARHYFSHKECHKKPTGQLIEMLLDFVNVDWYKTIDDRFKWGKHVKSIRVERRYSTMEIAKLPRKHAARKNPELLVARKEIRDMIPLFKARNHGFSQQKFLMQEDAYGVK